MNNTDLVAQFLAANTGVFWDILSYYDCANSTKLDSQFWKEKFELMERHDLRVDRIYLPNKKWISDIEFQHRTAIPLLNVGILGSLYGTQIYVNDKLPKHLAILCTENEFAKAVLLVNNNWRKQEEEVIVKRETKMLKYQLILQEF